MVDRTTIISTFLFIFCFNHSMDQNLILPDKGSGAGNDADTLEPNMEFYFIVACVAVLILVVTIQASCIIKMSGRNSALKKVKLYLFFN